MSNVNETVANAFLQTLYPGSLYLALMAEMPSDSGDGIEASFTNYVRQAISFTSAANKQKIQTATIHFPQADSGQVVVGYALYSASSGGALKGFSPFLTPQTIGEGDIVTVSAGTVTLNLV